MFGKRLTKESTKNDSDEIARMMDWIKQADAVLIGAGAGLSTAAGFTYGGERCRKYFSDFMEKYHFTDMYSGGFSDFDSLEEHWAYWSRYIYVNRYKNPPKPLYQRLLRLVEDKNYFVITTNVDHCFQKAGFDKKRLFYMQGDFGLFQCAKPCHAKTYDNEAVIKQMLEKQENMRVPSELIPKCPVCGNPMSMNLRADGTFVEDKGWHDAKRRYDEFVAENKNKNIVFLELGVGMNTPVWIKYPFWQMTMENDKARYVCLNYGDAVCPQEIREQAICINGDIDAILPS